MPNPLLHELIEDLTRIQQRTLATEEIDLMVFRSDLRVVSMRALVVERFTAADVENWAEVLSSLAWAERERVRVINEEGDEDPITPEARMHQALGEAITRLKRIDERWGKEEQLQEEAQ